MLFCLITAKPRQFVCDNNCPQWVSAQICSHTVAVAALGTTDVRLYQARKLSRAPTNVTSLAMAGMPSNRGRKKVRLERHQ